MPFMPLGFCMRIMYHETKLHASRYRFYHDRSFRTKTVLATPKTYHQAVLLHVVCSQRDC